MSADNAAALTVASSAAWLDAAAGLAGAAARPAATGLAGVAARLATAGLAGVAALFTANGLADVAARLATVGLAGAAALLTANGLTGVAARPATAGLGSVVVLLLTGCVRAGLALDADTAGGRGTLVPDVQGATASAGDAGMSTAAAAEGKIPTNVANATLQPAATLFIAYIFVLPSRCRSHTGHTTDSTTRAAFEVDLRL